MNSNITKLYKYRKIDKYLLESLINNELYFSHHSKLNDPLDCKINSYIESNKETEIIEFLNENVKDKEKIEIY